MTSASGRALSGRSSIHRATSDPDDRPRKMGWQVRQSVAEAVREAVESGAAESQNAFVEEALIRRLRELRRERVYSAYEEAAQDPAFMRDMRVTSEAYDATVRDGLEEGA